MIVLPFNKSVALKPAGVVILKIIQFNQKTECFVHVGFDKMSQIFISANKLIV